MCVHACARAPATKTILPDFLINDPYVLKFGRLIIHVLFHRWFGFACLNCVLVFVPEAQLNRERVIQIVDSAVQGGDGRNLAPGLHQLPVRPVTHNGKHTTAAVATEANLANASGKIFQQSLPHTIASHYHEYRLFLFKKDGDRKHTAVFIQVLIYIQ